VHVPSEDDRTEAEARVEEREELLFGDDFPCGNLSIRLVRELMICMIPLVRVGARKLEEEGCVHRIFHRAGSSDIPRRMPSTSNPATFTLSSSKSSAVIDSFV
jgi:hypothetical protein